MNNPLRLIATALISMLVLSACQEEPSRAYGIIERAQLQLSSPSPLQIKHIAVSRGEQVNKGAKLVFMDDTLQQQQVAAAQAALSRSQAALALLQAGTREEQLAQAQARVDASQATWQEAKRQLVRQQKLMAEGLTSQNALDSAKLAVDSSAAQFHEATELLKELQKGARVQTIEQAKLAVDEARAQLAMAQKQLQDLTLVAPTDGIVEELPWYEGERPPVGAPIVMIADSQQVFARLYLPEEKRATIKLGQTMQIHVDGNAQPLQGSISYISNTASFTPYFALSQQERARLMYVFEVRLPASTTLSSGTPVWMAL
ncbi:HlyD family secretion protein [Pseudoalteromonas fenneropenaei]|uniref:HlyD family secretion protein n=1 Tax=Pseudoalteromonas fenneropenaei TaxID=1737459 RepID=A0ABV7CJG5_9GAMM